MNTPRTCYSDPSKLGCKLVESGKDFETALGALLEAESNKINALVKAFSPEENCHPVCKDDLLNANNYLSQSLDCMKEIESIILKIITVGNIAIQTPKSCTEIPEDLPTERKEEIPIEKKEQIEEIIKNVGNYNIQDLEGFIKKFLSQRY